MAAAVMAVVAVRASGPSDLNEVDQPLQAAYVADILANGHYFVQWDHQGRIATKPPLYNWIAAGLIYLSGAPCEFVLKLPSVLAAFGTLLLTFLLARRWLEPWAALSAPLILASGHHFFKMAYLARTDMLFCFWVVLSIYAFERCRPGEGSEKTWKDIFWVAQGLAILTKGLAGPALVHVYVLARLAVERDLRGYLRLGALRGIPLLAVMSAAWLMPALYQAGDEFVERVLKGEILFRLKGAGPRARELQPFYAFLPWFIARFLPWSLLAVVALLQRGTLSPLRPRSPLLPAVLWLGAMMALLSFVPSKRPDWLMPLYPAGAILAAWLFQQVVGKKSSGLVIRSAEALLLFLSWLLAGCGLLIAALLAAPSYLSLTGPPTLEAIRRAHPGMALIAGVLLLLAGGAAWMGMRRLRPNMALAGFLAGLLALNILYYHAITPAAVSRDGDELKQFAARAREIICGAGFPACPAEKILFGPTRTPVQFFLLKNQRSMDEKSIIERMRRGEPFWLLMRHQELKELARARDITLEILLVSEYLEYDEDRLALARAKPMAY